MRTPRLFLRVYLHGVLLLVLVTVVVGVVWHAQGRRLHGSQPERVAAHLARWLAGSRDGSGIAADGQRLGEDLDVHFTLYAYDGPALAWSGPRLLPPLPEDDRERLRRGEVPSIRRHLTVSAPAGEGRYLVLSLLPLNRPLAAHAGLVLAALGLALALGSLPLARGIARPIERLSRAARRLGDGDLTVRSGIRRTDEIGTLAQAFDTMADRLQRLVQGQRELLVSVSHELRTPLARLGVTLGLAAEAESETGRAYLEQAAADLEELNRLVADTLATARLDAGDPAAVRPEALDPRQLLEGAAARFRRTYPKRDLSLDVAQALPELTGDPALLARVLDNLLDNARKYSDGEIVLAGRPEQGGVALEVRDRGIGIEAADLPRLFTPFFRTDRSRSRDTGGVGLGLAIAKRIVTAHGGRIEVASRPDQGTVVGLWLPGSRLSG
jgi:signal transduction histidine kinase